SGRQQVVLDSNGQLTTVYTFDDQGDITQKDQTFDGHTLTTSSKYDPVGRLTEITDPLQHKQSWTYDETPTTANGTLLSYTDAGGHTWRFQDHDSHGNAQTILAPDGSIY